MSSITKSFKDFFTKTFLDEKAYKDFDSHFTEMAIRHHAMNSLPTNLDEDDLEFLKQFPGDYWVSAKKARYKMLFQAVKDLHKKRHSTHAQGDLRKRIVDAMDSGRWGQLRGIVPDRNINWLTNQAPKMSAREKEKEAEKLAHEYIREKAPHVEDPGEVPFNLTSSDSTTRKSNTFMAKPFLNRLYHKLETTPGHPFHKDVEGQPGTTGTGKYGFDMTEPKTNIVTARKKNRKGEEEEVKVPYRSTSGWKFPANAQIARALTDFFNLNSHRMFGDLPEDAKWLPAHGLKDTHTVRYLKNEIFKKMVSSLRGDPKIKDEKELRNKATQMTKEKIIEMAKKGELKGPPIPGKFPDGIPITAEGPPGQEKLVNPPLYLPYETRDIKIRDENGERVEKRLVPLVNPAHFYRKLGSRASDYATDEEGQKIYDPNTKEPVYDVDPSKLRGHGKQFVHVGDDEFVRGTAKQGAAIDFNKETEQEMHLTKGDPGWKEAWDKIFAEQPIVDETGKPSPTGSFYKDIMTGIKRCFRGQCGGATKHEMDILRNNIADFHQMVVIKMLNSMSDPVLLTPAGRANFAYNKVSSIMQKDQGKGGGTRRLRKFAAGHAGRDASFSGGGDKDISDILMTQLAGGTGKSTEAVPNRGKGNRLLDTSGYKTPYNVLQMREILTQIEEEGREADTAHASARAMADEAIKEKKDVGDEVIDMLRNGVNQQVDFKMNLTGLLSNLYQQIGGQSKEDAEKTAERQIKGWAEDGISSAEQMLSAFKMLPVTQEAISKDKGQIQASEKEVPHPKEKEALEFARLAIDNMEHALSQSKDDDGHPLDEDEIQRELKNKFLASPGEPYSRAVKEMIKSHFGDDPKLLDRVQAEINRRFKVIDTPITQKQAARVVTPAKPNTEVDIKSQSNKLKDVLNRRKLNTTNTDSVPSPATPSQVSPLKVPIATAPIDELKAKKDWLSLSHHPEWLGGKGSFKNKQFVLNHFQSNKHLYQPHEHESAIANLRKSLGEDE